MRESFLSEGTYQDVRVIRRELWRVSLTVCPPIRRHQLFYHEVKDTEVAESQECSGSFKMPQGHVLVFVWEFSMSVTRRVCFFKWLLWDLQWIGCLYALVSFLIVSVCYPLAQYCIIVLRNFEGKLHSPRDGLLDTYLLPTYWRACVLVFDWCFFYIICTLYQNIWILSNISDFLF